MKDRQHEPPEYVTPPTLPPPKPLDALVTGQPHPDAYTITEEMAARAQDPRCPRPLALLLVAWVNSLNDSLAALVADRERLKEVFDALMELRAAQADWKRVGKTPVSAIMDERAHELPKPPATATLDEQALYGEALYAPYRERVTLAKARLERAVATVLARVSPPAGNEGGHE